MIHENISVNKIHRVKKNGFLLSGEYIQKREKAYMLFDARKAELFGTDKIERFNTI